MRGRVVDLAAVVVIAAVAYFVVMPMNKLASTTTLPPELFSGGLRGALRRVIAAAV